MTYNLGFFLGPGLPLSLGGALGSMIGGALLRPATAAPPLFFLPSTLGGGTREFGSGVSALAAGTGVALDSDDLSAGEGAGCTTEGVGADCPWEEVDADGFRGDVCGNRSSASGVRWRVTILVLREAFGVTLADADMAGGVDVVLSAIRRYGGIVGDDHGVGRHKAG